MSNIDSSGSHHVHETSMVSAKQVEAKKKIMIKLENNKLWETIKQTDRK